MFVIGFSLLGPAIIFTMLVYAQVKIYINSKFFKVAAFGLDSTRVFIYNGVPVCAFIFTCFCFESNIQLMFAKYVSIIYAFIMLAVLIGTTNQIVMES